MGIIIVKIICCRWSWKDGLLVISSFAVLGMCFLGSLEPPSVFHHLVSLLRFRVDCDFPYDPLL